MCFLSLPTLNLSPINSFYFLLNHKLQISTSCSMCMLNAEGLESHSPMSLPTPAATSENCTSDNVTCLFSNLFMPVEPAYNLIVEADKTLLSDAYRENVIIVSPISVMAILKYAQIAYRSEAFAKNIGELSKQGRYLCERIEKFLKNFNSIQERINALQKSFDDSKKTLSEGSQSVANTAQRFHELSLKALDSQAKKIETDTENE